MYIKEYSMGLAQKINDVVEQLPERQQVLVLELVKNLIDPDDILTEDDIRAIEKAEAEYELGECTRLEDIDLDCEPIDIDDEELIVSERG
jgi:hypothetical protein